MKPCILLLVYPLLRHSRYQHHQQVTDDITDPGLLLLTSKEWEGKKPHRIITYIKEEKATKSGVQHIVLLRTCRWKRCARIWISEASGERMHESFPAPPFQPPPTQAKKKTVNVHGRQHSQLVRNTSKYGCAGFEMMVGKRFTMQANWGLTLSHLLRILQWE